MAAPQALPRSDNFAVDASLRDYLTSNADIVTRITKTTYFELR